MIPQDLLKKVRRIELRTSRLVDDVLAGGYHSAFKGRGMEFEEVRQYQIGDDVRTIDWNVSARYGEPFVKLYREERELTVMLLVDVSGSQHFGTHEQFKDELVAEICATLSISAIRNNDKVGLICFSDRVEAYIPPRKGSKHVLRVIRCVDDVLVASFGIFDSHKSCFWQDSFRIVVRAYCNDIVPPVRNLQLLLPIAIL